MVGSWFYGMSTSVGLFYIENSSTILVSNYLRYKNVSSKFFWIGEDLPQTNLFDP